MARSVGTAWISKQIVREMLIEAERVTPLETGGVLMGYWTQAPDEVVITWASGPGPRALHRKYRFVPDADYHDTVVAHHYEASGRLHAYLGDWHTHPKSSPRLSWQDWRTLSRISRHEAARVATPIMAIAAGGPVWDMAVWRTPRLRLRPLVVEFSPVALRTVLYDE